MPSRPNNSVMLLARGIGFAALLLTACSRDQENAGGDNAANAISENAPAAAPGANSDAEITATANGATSAEGLLSKYVGKHPSETLNGKRFLDEPTVKAAVAATVADPRIRDFVFRYNGPDAPIVAKDGRILAWGCERHNCGYHNWSVAITPDGSNAQVCFYHNDDSADGPATWYLPDGKTEKRAGNCPSD